MPGRGLSTPVIWGDHIFVTTAVPTGKALEPRLSEMPGAHDNTPVTHEQEFQVLALDRRDGRLLWRRSVHRQVPRDGAHYTASFASHSPATDGERVYAYFGSHGLYCLDFTGEVRWQVDLGVLRIKHGHGEGSSPVLHGSTLVVNQDHEGRSILVALDKHTGSPARSRSCDGWSGGRAGAAHSYTYDDRDRLTRWQHDSDRLAPGRN